LTVPYKNIEDKRRASRRYAEEHKNERKERDRKWREANPDKVKQRSKRWRENHKEATKNYSYRRKYGITRDDKEAMYRAQNGLCGACGLPLPEDFHEADTDHNHVTGRVRALLHQRCNLVEGIETKHPGTLIKILEYKKRWEAVEQILPPQAEVTPPTR